MLRMSPFTRVTVAVSTCPRSCGPMMAASRPMMTTTTMISTSVKPRWACRDRRVAAYALILLPWFFRFGAPEPASAGRPRDARPPARKISQPQEVFVDESPARAGGPHAVRQRLGSWVPVLAIASIAVLFELFGDAGREALRYERDALEAGEAWRRLTGHLVHLGRGHLAMNHAAP